MTMTLYSWSFPNEGPDWPRSLRISIFRPVPSIPLHAPPPYKIQDLATPNNLFFFGGGICNERGTGRSKWLWSCNHKNIGTFFHYNRSMGGILERVWLIKRGFIFCFLVSFIMGLGQLSLLLTWSFIEITILIIIPLLRFNHLHNSLVLKYFLVQSIGSITLLTRLIFLFRLFDQKSLFLFLIVWKVALVLFLFYRPIGLGGLKQAFR